MPSEAATGMQANGSEPELRTPIAPLDMDVHGLSSIARVEEETIWPQSENRRHPASSSVYIAIRLPLASESVEKVLEATSDLFSGVRLPLPRVLASNLAHSERPIFALTERNHSVWTFSTASTDELNRRTVCGLQRLGWQAR